MSKKTAIITGATGGIGQEFVKQLLAEGIDEVWAIARNQHKLQKLKEQFGERIIPISLDLSSLVCLIEFQHILTERKPDISYLVNNAGLAKMGSYKDFSIEEIDSTVNLNCKAPVIMCRICIPYMKIGGRILNISSASSFQPNPYINLYAASKVFERSYTRALNVELKGTGITATAVCPGWVDTEMLIKELNGSKVTFPGMVTADKVVKRALEDAKKRKDMSVCSLYLKCQHINVKLLPQKLVMKIWMKGIKNYI